MALKIAVCDDTKSDLDAIGAALRTYVDREHIICSITSFDDPTKVLAHSNFDLYFLDIVMPLMDGMALAQKLRELYPGCGIVFITSSADYAVHGYNVEAAAYLLKPLDTEQLELTFRRIFARYAPPTLPLSVEGAPVEVPINAILFMESQLRNTVVYLKNGETMLLRRKLEDIWQQAQVHNAFVRCHKSFVVNLDYVLHMENTFFKLVDGTQIPVSRNARVCSKTAYYQRKVQAGARP